MEDTIHLGWRGWLKMDQQVKPFLSRKQPAAHYRIQNRFFSRTWQLAQNK
jgi:D-alanine transfer protein